eukprot:12780549-Alexandrium_andersonii.AAC.1
MALGLGTPSGGDSGGGRAALCWGDIPTQVWQVLVDGSPSLAEGGAVPRERMWRRAQGSYDLTLPAVAGLIQ